MVWFQMRQPSRNHDGGVENVLVEIALTPLSCQGPALRV